MSIPMQTGEIDDSPFCESIIHPRTIVHQFDRVYGLHSSLRACISLARVWCPPECLYGTTTFQRGINSSNDVASF
ncbi:unnamed protein product [Calypogeia fissa]